MMIELLLVIAVAMIVFYLGLERYRAYYQSMQLDLVQSDVVAIREALNRYYNQLPCSANGMWQGPLNTDVSSELGTVLQRMPYVDRYRAIISDSGAVTKNQKPIYQLDITADINNRYQAQLAWLNKRLAATRYIGKIMYWVGLPNNSIAESSSILWVMNVSRDQFKNLKNDATLAQQVVSHAYCAR